MADKVEAGSPVLDAAIYGGLKLTTTDSIRVLELLPGRREDELRIGLRVVTLDSRPKYEALSYTWGASTEGHVIRVNGEHQLPVTDNLFRALRGLRGWFRSRMMWIDAICIDQSNLEEKNQQVRMMGRIYQEASCTDIWLGDPKDAIRPAKKAFPDFGEFFFNVNVWTCPRAMLGHLRQEAAMINDALESSNPRWHNRGWTIQEFVLSQHVFLCFGKRRTVCQPDRIRNLPGTVFLSGFTDFAAALTARLLPAKQAILSGTRISMVTVTELARETLTRDPRDKVYSLRSLIVPEEATAMEVDYSMPCWKVYAKATFSSLGSLDGCDILQYVKIFGRKTMGLPTWTVDFTSLPSVDLNMDALTTDTGLPRGPYHKYERRRDLRVRRPRVTLDESLRYLSIEGARCDIIASVVRTYWGTTPPTLSHLEEVGSLVQQAIIAVKAAFETRDAIKRGFSHGPNLVRMIIERHGSIGIKNIDPNDVVTSFKHGMPSAENMVPYVAFQVWSRTLQFPADSMRGTFETEAASLDFAKYATEVALGQALFVTKTGVLGIAPATLTNGDILVVVRSRWPFIILRPTGQCFKFRGLAYVHSFMLRAFWDHYPDRGFEEFQEETFVLE